MKLLRDYQSIITDLCIHTDGDLDTRINNLTDDSRSVVNGSLFVAIQGSKLDGRAYIPEAIRRGAVGVIYKNDSDLHLSVPSIRVSNDYQALGKLAEYHYDYPGSTMKTVGVTGTNGKTTTSLLIDHIIRGMKAKTGIISTIKTQIGSTELPSELTTPSAIELQRRLSLMRDNGVKFAVIEISSHGLAQNRIGTMAFDVVVFTNLTGDHLDYHNSMADYFRAKSLLFTKHLNPFQGTAIINGDDKYGIQLCDYFRDIGLNKVGPQGTNSFSHWYEGNKANRVITFGLRDCNMCYPVNCDVSIEGTRLDLQFFDQSINLVSKLIGIHNG